MTRRKLLPLWVFLTILLVLGITFGGMPAGAPNKTTANGNKIIPIAGEGSVQKIVGVPGEVMAGQCGYCGWYSLCDNNTRWCCTQWIQAGCGGGGGSTTNPPTIAGTVSCGTSGSNGWCVGNPQLNLSASDPQGYSATISGTINGTAFTCGSSCTEPLPKGTGSANYTATSSTSGMTASGNSTWSYDPDPPVISPSISGTGGLNGWYISPVTINANASDVISGVASVQYNLDGGGLQPGGLVSISTDGSHTVSFLATDNASNTSSGNASSAVKIDTSAPSLSLAVSGTSGTGGWYTAPVTVSASASDSVSGIASTEYSVDGGAWQSGTAATISSDGTHTVDFRTTDQAGNVTTASKSFNLDQVGPVIALSPSGTSGSNGWYISNVNTAISVTDPGSGVLSSQYSVDGGALTSNADGISVPFSDGSHTLSVNAIDKAGNSSSKSLNLQVDMIPPSLTVSVKPIDGTNGWYKSLVSVSAASSDNGSGIASTEYNLNGGMWKPYGSAITLPEGSSTLQFRATDKAGNTTVSASQSYQVDTALPVITASVSGSSGQNGWYVSDATVNGSASDALSGLSSLDVSVDGGPPSAYAPVTLHDGIHTVVFSAADNAGNVATKSIQVKLDTTNPQIGFDQSLTKTALTGSVALFGVAQDPTSGLSSVEVSTDNGASWKSAASFMGGTWRLTWNTGGLLNGAYSVLLRAMDNAGNPSSTSTGLMLDNQPPLIGLSGWTYPGAGYVAVSSSVWPIAHVQVTVNDPAGLWSDNIYSSNNSGPLSWGGRLLLFPGAYPLKAEVCDVYGMCAKAEGSVLVNVFPTITPTPTLVPPTTVPQQKPQVFVRPATAVPTPTQTLALPTLAIATPVPPPAAPTEAPFVPIAVGALTLFSAALLITDPRPYAWRNLTLTASQGIQKNKQEE